MILELPFETLLEIFLFLPHLCDVSQVCSKFKSVINYQRDKFQHSGAVEVWYRVNQSIASISPHKKIGRLSRVKHIPQLGLYLGYINTSMCLESIFGNRIYLQELIMMEPFTFVCEFIKKGKYLHHIKVGFEPFTEIYSVFFNLRSKSVHSERISNYEMVNTNRFISLKYDSELDFHLYDLNFCKYFEGDTESIHKVAKDEYVVLRKDQMFYWLCVSEGGLAKTTTLFSMNKFTKVVHGLNQNKLFLYEKNTNAWFEFIFNENRSSIKLISTKRSDFYAVDCSVSDIVWFPKYPKLQNGKQQNQSQTTFIQYLKSFVFIQAIVDYLDF